MTVNDKNGKKNPKKDKMKQLSDKEVKDFAKDFMKKNDNLFKRLA